MKSATTAIAALLAFVCLMVPGLAQDAARTSPGASSPGEEAMDDVDPAVLDRCRRQAEEQSLKDGPARKAFMGTCVTPED